MHVTESATEPAGAAPAGVAATPGLEYKTAAVAGAVAGGADSGVLATDDATGVVEALVSVTGVVDNDRDIIEPGAYTATLARRRPKGIFSHDWKQWASRSEVVEELMPGDPRLTEYAGKTGKTWPAEAGALYVKTRYNLATPEGRSAYENVKFFGDECQWSIGYRVPAGKSVRAKDGVRRIREVDLFEYSPVLFGAASLSGTLSVKAAAVADDTETEPVGVEDGDDAEAPHGVGEEDPAGDVEDAELDVDVDAAELAAVAELFDAAAEAEAVAEALAEPDEEGEGDGEGQDGGEPAGPPDAEFDVDEALEAPTGDGQDDGGDDTAEEDGAAEGGEAEPDDEAKAIPGMDRKPAPKSGSGARATTPGGDNDAWKITNVEQLRAAVRAFGNVAAGDKEKVKAHIMKRAFALKRPDLIPDGWKKNSSGKDILGAAADLTGVPYQWQGEEKRDFSGGKRQEMAKEGTALPDGSYPIKTAADVKNAVQAFGRAKPADRAKVKAHIIRRARALGCTNLLPDDWTSSDSSDSGSKVWRIPLQAKGWDSAAHPRVAAGGSGGGQFMAYDSSKKSGTGYGKKGGDARVQDLQKALNRLGFTDGKGKKLDVDGQLGPLTTQAIKAAQKKMGVPADGKVSGTLLAKLLANAKKKGTVTAAVSTSGGPKKKPGVAVTTSDNGKKKPKTGAAATTTTTTTQARGTGTATTTVVTPTVTRKKKKDAGDVDTKMAHEPLDSSPKKNWVEMAGQLPAYIQHIAKDLHEERGMPLSQAIPTAIAAVKKWAAGGGGVTPETRTKAAAAVAEWEKLKASSHARTAARHAAKKGMDGLDGWTHITAHLPGSFEQLHDELLSAATGALDDGTPSLVEVLGTWPDRMVATRYPLGGDGKAASFEIGYQVDGDAVTLADPVPVHVTVDHDGVAGDAAALEPFPAMVEEVAGAVKAMVDIAGLETKAGRVLSGANATRLKQAVEHLVAVLKIAGIEIGAPKEMEAEPDTPAEQDSTAPSVRGENLPAGKMLVDPALYARAYRVLAAAHSGG